MLSVKWKLKRNFILYYRAVKCSNLIGCQGVQLFSGKCKAKVVLAGLDRIAFLYHFFKCFQLLQ